MPDSEAFGDVGVDTFGHIAYTVKTMEIPNLKKLGILNLHPQKICSSRSAPSAARGFRSCYKRCLFRSIRQAMEMLTQTNDRVLNICYACGFNNINHFNRIFKSIVGVSPTQYRSANREEAQN